MNGRSPKDNRRGEVLAVAKRFARDKITPNTIDDKNADGSFCTHDLGEALPHLLSGVHSARYAPLNVILNEQIERGQIIKLMNKHRCKQFDRLHLFYRYNDIFKQKGRSIAREELSNLGKSEPEAPKATEKATDEPIARKLNIGSGRIRDIEIKISDDEIQLRISKN